MASIVAGEFSLNAAYDGQGNVDWTMTNNAGFNGSGSSTLPCVWQ